MSFLAWHLPSAWRVIQKLQLLHTHLHELCQCSTSAITNPMSLGVTIKVLVNLFNFKCKLLLSIYYIESNLSECWDALLSNSEMMERNVCGFLPSFPIPKALVCNVHPAQSGRLIIFDCQILSRSFKGMHAFLWPRLLFLEH